MSKTKAVLVAAGLAVAVMAGRADAQQSGLVNVSLTNVDVLNNIANNLHVNVSQIPVTVQAPIGVAANVCNVAANVLAANNPAGGGTCTATSTSTALNHIVQRQLLTQ